MILPLPEQIIIKGVQWVCIGTADTEDGIIDTLRNTDTREIRKVERMKLITFLEKNPSVPCEIKNKNVNLQYSNQLNINL
jgi:hypothetical protein